MGHLTSFVFSQYNCYLCVKLDAAAAKLLWPTLVVIVIGSSGDPKLSFKERNSRWPVCLTLSLWNLFSGLPGSDLLRSWGVCTRRVSLLCGMGWARMWEPQGLLHGPVLWTRSLSGRYWNLQLWSQLDRPWLLHRWVPPSHGRKHWQDSLSQTRADLPLIVKHTKVRAFTETSAQAVLN